MRPRTRSAEEMETSVPRAKASRGEMAPFVTPSIGSTTSRTRAVSRRTAVLGETGPLVERTAAWAHEMSVPERPRNRSVPRSKRAVTPVFRLAAQMSLPRCHSSFSLKWMSLLLQESTSSLDPMTRPATEITGAL